MLRLEDVSPYTQVRCMLQTLGLTGDSVWRFGDRGYYSNTKRHCALMRAVDAARQDAEERTERAGRPACRKV